MIDGAFCIARGVGPARERELAVRGILSWDAFPETGLVLSKTLDERLREAIGEGRRLLAARRWKALSELISTREHWRILSAVEGEASYLDIETTAEGQVTVVGVWDPKGGPRLYVRGCNLGDFVSEQPEVFVTFNGASFDLPILRRSFPRWHFSGVHIDLRTVLAQLGERGGLKAIETRLGIGRPEHLQGVSGADAITLWNEFRRSRSESALRKLLEYNLYDVVQMRSLAQIACERLARRSGRSWSPEETFRRGDVLFDLSREVERIVAEAPRIDPEAFDDEERLSLRLG